MDNPIVFTVTNTEEGYRMTTKDTRVYERDRNTLIHRELLFGMLQFASQVYNNKGYAVLFEID